MLNHGTKFEKLNKIFYFFCFGPYRSLSLCFDCSRRVANYKNWLIKWKTYNKILIPNFIPKKENEEVEEVEEFKDEISSGDDEDLDDLVEEEVAVATCGLKSGKKRMPLSHSDYDFYLINQCL